jgi:FeS assembly SUF system protein
MDDDKKRLREDLSPSGAAGGERVSSNDVGTLEQRVVAALRKIYDPEIPVNIYDLGLVYELRVDEAGAVNIRMTLTAPGCPVAQSFPGTVEQAVRRVPGVSEAHVELVWEPPWSRERLSEAARLELGML